MTTYNTGNPIGSTDPRDLYDNAQNLDTAMHTAATTWADRLGNSRPSWAGATGYQSLGDYAAGIQVTTYNQVIRAAGEYWRAAAGTALPYTTTGAGMPESGKFVSVGDAVLRADLVDGDGSSLVGFQQSGTGAVSTNVQSKLRKTIHVTDYGIGSGVTDDRAKIQTLLNEVSAAGGGEIIFDSEEDYLVTDCILVPSNLVFRFTGNGYVKLTQSSTIGAVMVVFGTAVTPAENVTIYNPRIDAGNFGHPTSAAYGENGIGGSKCRNVQIFGGLVKNCRRGSSNPVGTGGKAVQFEGGVEDILVDGLTAMDCTIAMETGGSPDLTGYERYRNVQYKNMRAFNCDRIISVMHSTSPPDASVTVGLVQIDGVLAFNCGRESVAGTEKNFGAITIDRASNVTIKNVVIANEAEYGTLGAVVRQASGTNCDIDVSITGSADALVLHAVGSTGFGTTGTCQDNIYKVTHKGTAGYAISHVAEVTLQENLYYFVTDVISTGFVDAAAALGSLYCTFVSGGKATVVQGTALSVYAYLANTYPAQNFAVGGTVSINGLIITLGYGSKVITTAGTDQLLLQYAGSTRVTLNANGVLLGGLPTYADNAAATAAGLAVGQLYRTATGQIFIRY